MKWIKKILHRLFAEERVWIVKKECRIVAKTRTEAINKAKSSGAFDDVFWTWDAKGDTDELF